MRRNGRSATLIQSRPYVPPLSVKKHDLAQGAIKDHDVVLATDPTNALARASRGECRLWLGDIPVRHCIQGIHSSCRHV